MSVVLSHSVCGILLQQLWETNHTLSSSFFPILPSGDTWNKFWSLLQIFPDVLKTCFCLFVCLFQEDISLAGFLHDTFSLFLFLKIYFRERAQVGGGAEGKH